MKTSRHCLWILAGLLWGAGSLSAQPTNAAAGFLQVIETDATVPGPRRQAARDALGKARADGTPDHQARPLSLAQAYPEYQEGIEAAAAGDETRAVERFTRLASGPQPYLAAQARLDLARLHVYRERFELARPLLERLTGPDQPYLADGGESLFLLGAVEARQMNWTNALKHLQQFFDNHPQAPERLRSGAQQILAELKRYKPESLREVRAHMDDARRRLQLADVGASTRQAQETVVALLAKLIEKAEDGPPPGAGGSEQPAGEEPNGQSPDDKPGDQPSQDPEKDKPGKPSSKSKPGGPSLPGQSGSVPNSSSQPQRSGSAGGSKGQLSDNPPMGPSNESVLPPSGGGGIGAINRVTRGQAGEVWGAARDRKRDEILNADKTQIPDRYRELVEQYYKSLQEEKPH